MTEMLAQSVTMRRMVPADREAVIALCRAIDPADYVPDMLNQEVPPVEPPAGFYVAEMDGQIVGCHAQDCGAPGSAFLYAMRIDPRLQGQGIGRAYVKAQVEEAVRQGLHDLFLSSAPTNIRAHRAVERNGFVNRGQWFIYESAPLPTVPLGTGRARPAVAADLPQIAAFREHLKAAEMADVFPAFDYPYGFAPVTDADWAVENLTVVAGEGRLDGLMWLSKSWGAEPYIRRLEGTPEAAVELLGYAAAWARAEDERGKWTISLPTRCENLIAPLGLDPATCEPWFIFHYRAE